MKRVEFWYWWVPHSFKPGKLVKSPCRMEEAVAQERYPGCTRVEGSCEPRDLPETDEEFARANFHSINAGRPRER